MDKEKIRTDLEVEIADSMIQIIRDHHKELMHTYGDSHLGALHILVRLVGSFISGTSKPGHEMENYTILCDSIKDFVEKTLNDKGSNINVH